MRLFHSLFWGAAGLACAVVFCCLRADAAHAAAQQPPFPAAAKPATMATREANKAMLKDLDFTDRQDFEDARRGFVAPLPDNGRIPAKNGGAAWDLEPYAFVAPAMSRDMPASRIMPTPAPDTVNPSLWRQSQLVMADGLYKVTERIYQIRNADISNMTIIEGDTGLIVADPLVSEENAAAALALYYQHRPKKPVKAVIYSHSHLDHYGGAAGVVSAADAQNGKVKIIAPEGFLEAAVSENVLAGTAMSRRAMYMYGTLLPVGPQGHVGSGLGLKNSSGATGLIPPTEIVSKSGQILNLDGLDFVFLMAPNTEAPAEMHWYIPALKALTAAENCTHTMHNLYTLRGAKTRDPLSWSRALDQTLELWGNEAEVLYGMHHWPVWGNERVRQTLALGRDLYRYINDQTLRLANQGLTMPEIAETLRLPPELARHFALRGYYGSLNHNVKAVYNFYLGWFDGNPAHLHALPPREAAANYVEYMGGPKAVLERARKDFEKGRYRWVAQVLDHVVFADPSNEEARELEADALEQLGYQAESGPWRNFYLSGAQDLRRMRPHERSDGQHAGSMGRKINAQQKAMPPEMFFDYLAVRLNGQKAQGRQMAIRVVLTDAKAGEIPRWDLNLANSVLHARKAGKPNAGEPGLTFTGGRQDMLELFSGSLPLQVAQTRGMLQGDVSLLQDFLAMLDVFHPDFNLVLP